VAHQSAVAKSIARYGVRRRFALIRAVAKRASEDTTTIQILNPLVGPLIPEKVPLPPASPSSMRSCHLADGRPSWNFLA
jgi:hypothetical protein